MQTNDSEVELLGALLGDGFVSLASHKYIFGLTGNPITDKDYFDYLTSLIYFVCNKKVVPKVRSHGIRISVYSKNYCLRLINDFEFFPGEGKAINAKIPNFILSDWKMLKFVLRGLFDTDGSVFYSKKPCIEKYPSLELTTSSIVLAEQVREALLCQGFRVTKIRSYFSKLSKHRTYKLCLYGKGNLHKWMKEIGFSNPYKSARAKALLSVP
jgi:DNA-binding transcriptional regulator WhiA